jgi:hypothetical protein
VSVSVQEFLSDHHPRLVDELKCSFEYISRPIQPMSLENGSLEPQRCVPVARVS